MHTRGAEPWLSEAARDVADHASALVRLEFELAALEVKRKLAALAIGIGLGLAAALVILYALGFALAGAASGLAAAVPTWAALLIVAGILLLLAAILGLFAAQSLKRGAPPVPEQAIQEARVTTEVLKGDGAGA
jgi:hypothetical protein